MHCTDHSLSIDEPLAGSAAESIHTWILIEYPRSWPTRIKVADLDLPENCRELLKVSAMKPGHKCLLIRQPKRSTTRIFWVDDSGSRVADQHSDADWSLESTDGWQAHDLPFLLVCNHGSRDRCCGTLGGLVFAKLHRERPDWVWQSSHLGGHRFAPVALSLPDGMLYGRIPLERCLELLNCVEEGSLWSPEYRRGSTRESKAIQALQIHLAKHFPSSRIVDVLQSEKVISADVEADGKRLSVSVSYRAIGSIQVSCGDPAEKEIGAWLVG